MGPPNVTLAERPGASVTACSTAAVGTSTWVEEYDEMRTFAVGRIEGPTSQATANEQRD
jgi:hypothetical protein